MSLSAESDIDEVRLRAESGRAEIRLGSKFKLLEQQFVRKPHSAKVKILIRKFSLKRWLEICALLFTWTVKHAVPLVFEFPIEGFSGARFAHPLFAVANKSGFGFRCW